MDGFGAGYASLSFMQPPVPNTVKIEQSFVRNMIDNPDDLTIIEGVIARCKSLKQASVAEGVETLEHRTLFNCFGLFYRARLWYCSADAGQCACGLDNKLSESIGMGRAG